MKKNKTDVESYKFGRVVKELMKMSGKTFREVIRAEAGHVLAGSMDATRVGNKGKIIRHQMPMNYRYQRTKGEKEFGKIGSNWFYLGGRHPDQRWQELLGNREKRTAKNLENRGITASQFFIMAKMLNIKLPRPPKNQAISNRSHDKIRKVLKPHEQNASKNKYLLILETSAKGNSWIGGKGKRFKSAGYILENKVAGRKKMFAQAIRKGFINDIKFRTKNYPLLFR
jgi:hypothetical protein